MTDNYKMIVENTESTVVGKYKSMEIKESKYQNENELEKEFIEQLTKQGYEYLDIKQENDLINNLKKQIEKLNNYNFTNAEWSSFFKKYIANSSETVEEKTNTIQNDYIKVLTRDDGEQKNIYLLDKQNIYNNNLQVINQYEADAGEYKNRYDVTILINGFPIIHIELKRRGVNIKEAFNQIERYKRESFWADAGLFEYVQIFVISNGTYTKYYSNSTRKRHIDDKHKSNSGNRNNSSNSFEFTMWWADAENNCIYDLMDFTKTFFVKHTILNILTKYCVFDVDKKLLIMRPYQIVATERIINKIKLTNNYKQTGTIKATGYIWHTTGSGKTLTSFKTAQLATKLNFIDKVLFVVDRKDLDYQTMREYDRFEKGSANSNTNTEKLKQQLENVDLKIIITTIQKLSCFIKKNKQHPITNKQIVLIFDECHRSQFGEMHKYIEKFFKNYYLFGFTGTPIIEGIETTAKIFGGEENGKPLGQLHSYTILDAIRDKNVLPFRVAYIKTFTNKNNINDLKVMDINRKEIFESPERIKNVVEYILKNFNIQTKRNDKSYRFNVVDNVQSVVKSRNSNRSTEEIKKVISLTGFNSIFTVSSIEMAKKYYEEFEKQQEQLPFEKQLKIAVIYSYSPNADENIEDENVENTGNLSFHDREFLDDAIKKYNKQFDTNYDTSSEKFQNYYRDISLRVKNREIDLLIVVNMFLTGFDATTLNTLWVDRDLKLHSLIQAYSRTNRILNSVKSFGNIVCFRNLEQETNDAIALFSNSDAKNIVLLKTFKEYFEDGYYDNNNFVKPYKDLVNELKKNFKINDIVGETKENDFIKLYNAILRLKNILTSFEEFKDLLTEREIQDYSSIYLELKDKRKKEKNAINVNDDIVFETELLKQYDINIDYILFLIEKYTKDRKKEIIIDIEKNIDSNVELRSKKDLILKFIDATNTTTDIYKDWKVFIEEQKLKELNEIIEDEKLNKDETIEFMKNCFESREMKNYESIIGRKILPKMNLFDKNNSRNKKRNIVVKKLTNFFDRYKNLI